MKKHEEMLVITMEECGELTQACSKVIRTKDDTKYVRKMQDEIGDVMLMIEILKNNGYVTDKQIKDRMIEKKKKLVKWSLLFDG
tara:strand:+ start:8446 stop:8697 length:252 start_codon:yes stop_codon:yes gene_type:complete